MKSILVTLLVLVESALSEVEIHRNFVTKEFEIPQETERRVITKEYFIPEQSQKVFKISLEGHNAKTIQLKQQGASVSQLQPHTPVKTLSSPRVTNWGNWGEWANCKGGSYVMGMTLRTEPFQGDGMSGHDDTALNAIRLLCSSPGSVEYDEIQSAEGAWGSFGSKFICPGNMPAMGFQLRSEASQGSGDDTAANNLRLLCNGESVEGDGKSWGEWSEVQLCSYGTSLCGFRTQVEPSQGDGDDTALNNVDMACCKYDRPV